MNNLIHLSKYIYTWKMLFEHDCENSTLQIYYNESTGEMEIVQMNDEGEMIRTCLGKIDSTNLIHVVGSRLKNVAGE